jgi:carotenoid cleavage dioxygenase-like enzyme
MAQPMSATNPFLNFPYGPIQMECEAQDLIVEGEIPADLCGTLYRAGPNQRFKPRGDYHLFMGDGELQQPLGAHREVEARGQGGARAHQSHEPVRL